MATIENIIERLKIAVMRHGVQGAIIDPYNYIQKNGDRTETDWISEMLTQLRVCPVSRHPPLVCGAPDKECAVPTERSVRDMIFRSAAVCESDVGMSFTGRLLVTERGACVEVSV